MGKPRVLYVCLEPPHLLDRYHALHVLEAHMLQVLEALLVQLVPLVHIQTLEARCAPPAHLVKLQQHLDLVCAPPAKRVL